MSSDQTSTPLDLSRRPSESDYHRLLRRLGCIPIPPLEAPTHWNPWDGTGAVHWAQLEDRIVEAITSGRQAILKKPWWRTSEFWLASTPVFMAVPAGAIAISGLAGDLLPPPLDKWVAGLCTGLVAFSAAAYKFSTSVAKYLKEEEAKEQPPTEPAKAP